MDAANLILTKYKSVRGIRNNNPGNIVRSNSKWLHKLENPADGRFEQFETMYWGVRACVKLIRSYIRSGYATINQIIRRYCFDGWEVYAARVEAMTGIHHHKWLGVVDSGSVQLVVLAIFAVENGMSWDESNTCFGSMVEEAWESL